MSLEWLRARARENQARSHRLAVSPDQHPRNGPVLVELTVRFDPAEALRKAAAHLPREGPAANQVMDKPEVTQPEPLAHFVATGWAADARAET